MHVGRKAERRLGVQADLVGHVREVGLARSDAADQLQRLLHIEVRVVGREAQGIDDQYFHAVELALLRRVDGFEVGEVTQAADAVSRHLEARRVVPRHGYDPRAGRTERLGGVDRAERQLGHAAVFVRGESVVEILAHDIQRAGRAVDVHAPHRGVIDEVEGPHVVQAARVVLVLVREQDGVDAPHARA